MKKLNTTLIVLMSISIIELNIAQEQKLLADDGQTNNLFGTRLDIDGNYAVIANSLSFSNIERKAVYIFSYNGVDWIQEFKVDSSILGETTGSSGVSISEETLVIGSDERALIFEKDGTSWNLLKTFVSDDSTVAVGYGWTVDNQYGYIFIGALLENGETGAVYVYRFNGSDWIYSQKLEASDGFFGDRFGYDISVDGNFAIISSVYLNDMGLPINYGSAYIFERSDTTWNEVIKFIPDESDSLRNAFGYSVSIDGNYAIVGDPQDDQIGENSGAVYIYFMNGLNHWTRQEKLTPLYPNSHSYSESVSITDNFCFVGATFDTGRVAGTGAIHIYQRTDTIWVWKKKIYVSDGDPVDLFSWPTKSTNEHIIAAAFQDDDNGPNAGAAYIYKINDIVSVFNSNKFQPEDYYLLQNFPNPFNPTTTINYQIPELSFVTIKVYDVLGNEITTLVNEENPAGNYTIEFNSANLPSGIYFYQLQANNFTQTKKMILMK